MSDGQQPNRDQLPLEIEQQIDRLSDEFESAWKKGEPRGSRTTFHGSRRITCLRCCGSWLLWRSNSAWPTTSVLVCDEYLARFPDQREAVLAGLAMFDPQT